MTTLIGFALRRHVPAPVVKPPHIIMVLDESSFDITRVPGVNVPPATARISSRSTAGSAR